ncbi:DJ-1/PfpI family protein domain-containing protein [Chloropicon primus]|nr:DJ-1/PfpI family protein domain-containing protein [Chloropicon primus]
MRRRTCAVVVFEGVELLDVAAPVEILGALGTNHVHLCYVLAHHQDEDEDESSSSFSFSSSCVTTSCLEVSGGCRGPRIVGTHVLASGGRIRRVGTGVVEAPHVVVVPGGKGARELLGDRALQRWLVDACSSEECEVVLTVCTGSWLLARSGVLDGLRATCNKGALASGAPQRSRPQVDWVRRARWVEHRTAEGKLFVTSSGVSAGGDAALAVVSHLAGEERARGVARDAEWIWNENADDDPFCTAE